MRSLRRAAAHIEFALVLPVAIVLITGTMEYAWLFWQRISLIDVVRKGCRDAAVVDPTREDPAAAAVGAMTRWAAAIHNGLACGDDAAGNCVLTAQLSGTIPRRSLECTATLVAYEPLIGLVPVPEEGVLVRSITLLELQVD
jgi:Flp pilus assembly protein TadG